MPKTKVALLNRLPGPGHFSIERLFSWISPAFPTQVEVQSLQCPHLSQGFRNRWQNIRWAKQQSGDILHITGDVHYLALGTPRKRTILTIHDVVFLNQKKGLRRWILWLFWVYLPVRQAGLITVISKASADSLKEQIPTRWHQKIRIVPNCVDPNMRFQPKESMPQQPRILLIGTKPNKNLMRQLEALRLLNVKVHLIGHENRQLREYLEKYRNPVQWDQGVSDEAMRQAYIDCDLLLFASLEEGFGLPILEAQAVGRPVVTSKQSSMPEVAGPGASLVNPTKIEEIRAAVKKITKDSDYRNQLVQAGYVNVQTYSAKQVAQSYLKVYRELLD